MSMLTARAHAICNAFISFSRFLITRLDYPLLNLPAASCRESSKCKEVIPFYCSSLGNPAAPKAGSPLRYDKLRGMRSLKHFQYSFSGSLNFVSGGFAESCGPSTLCDARSFMIYSLSPSATLPKQDLKQFFMLRSICLIAYII